MSSKVAHEVTVDYGPDGSIRVDEESLFKSPKVHKQLAAAENWRSCTDWFAWVDNAPCH